METKRVRIFGTYLQLVLVVEVGDCARPVIPGRTPSAGRIGFRLHRAPFEPTRIRAGAFVIALAGVPRGLALAGDRAVDLCDRRNALSEATGVRGGWMGSGVGAKGDEER